MCHTTASANCVSSYNISIKYMYSCTPCLQGNYSLTILLRLLANPLLSLRGCPSLNLQPEAVLHRY